LGSMDWKRGCGYWQVLSTTKLGQKNWQDTCKHCGKRQRLGQGKVFAGFADKLEGKLKAIEMNTLDKFQEIKDGKNTAFLAKNNSDKETNRGKTPKGFFPNPVVSTGAKTTDLEPVRNIELELATNRRIEAIRNGDEKVIAEEVAKFHTVDEEEDWF
jgi:hypothetical protein